MKTSRLPVILGCCMYLFSGGTCKMGESFYRYDIINNSYNTITCFRLLTGNDTILPETKPGYIVTVQPGSARGFTSQVPYDEMFQSLPRDTMSFYFFDHEVFSNIDWSEVRENRMFLIRYELSLDDLKKLNFEIAYPPTEAMQDMKIVSP